MNNLEILRGYHSFGIEKLMNTANEIATTIKEINAECEILEG